MRSLCHSLLLVAVGVFPFACGPSTPPPAAPAPTASASASARETPVAAEPPEGPVPTLRTGAIARVDHAEVLDWVVSARSVDATYELLAVDIRGLENRDDLQADPQSGVVNIDGGALWPYAFASATTVWIRRPRAEQGKPVAGALFLPQSGHAAGHRFPFRATVDATVKSDPKLTARWAKALSAAIHARGASPWHLFAADRVMSVFGEKKPLARGGPAAPGFRQPLPDLLALMDTTTGMMSIQEALQADRPLLLRAAREKATVKLGTLVGPKAAAHPWGDLLRSLGKTAPTEPLAAAAPAEFYYMRAADLGVLFQLSDQLDAWATPIVGALDRDAAERDLTRRYETQLGLARTALARAFGKEVVADVALVGSDPYVREGSDLSVIFRVKQRLLFETGLAGTLSTRAGEHGGVTTTTLQHQGYDVHIARSSDGAVRQHRATAGDLEVVSNSVGAMKRILDTIKGKHPRLADEKDFAYLLARDAGIRADALGFMGDRFVGEVIGARQKVLESRRQLALAELMTPGFAALLHGWVMGRSPASAEELIASKLLSKDELKHAGGAPIAWKPGEAAQSVFGTPGALTPLIDLPDPDLVTESERTAYERFSRTYESYWRTYIDPAALRVSVDTTPAGTTLVADLRVMPLIEGTDYRDILAMAGQARVNVPALGSGARAVVGIGPNAMARKELAGLARDIAGTHGFALDFLGDWAMAGVDDRTALADVVRTLDRELPQRPPQSPDEQGARVDEAAVMARTPAYAAVGISSMAGAALALAAIHLIADDILPGAITWAPSGKERDVAIVRVVIAESRGRRPTPTDRASPEPGIAIFYALTSGMFLTALNEHTLRHLIDDALDGHGPGPVASGSGGSQLVVDISGDKQGALFTVLSWLLSQELLQVRGPSAALAEALLVGAADRTADAATTRSLALAYLGVVPVPPEGGAWTLGPDGVRDPVHGSASAPTWPALPIPGSAVDRLLGAVGRFRSEIAFDREGAGNSTGKSGLQSLHARVTLGLRGQ